MPSSSGLAPHALTWYEIQRIDYDVIALSGNRDDEYPQRRTAVLGAGNLAVIMPRRSTVRSLVSDLERSASYYVLGAPQLILPTNGGTLLGDFIASNGSGAS